MSARVVIKLSGPDKDGLYTARIGDDFIEHRRTEWSAHAAVIERARTEIARLAQLHDVVVLAVERAKPAG